MTAQLVSVRQMTIHPGRTVWTPELDAALVEMAATGTPTCEIGKALGVSEAAAATRMSRIDARPRLDALTQEAIAEKVEQGWRHSRIARQYGIPEALIPSVVAAVEKSSQTLSNDRRVDRFGESLRRGPKPKPRPDWTTTPLQDPAVTKNRLSDLNDHLFAQLERLSDEDLSSEEIEKEATRAEAIVAVADKIIQNASLSISAAKLVAGQGADPRPYLRTIEGQVSGAARLEDRS